MPLFPKPYADVVQRLRVTGGFVVAGALAWFSQPTVQTLLAGLPLCFAGLALRAWAAGHLRKNQKLTVSGPYAWTRNPLYLGSLMLAFGFVVASGQPWLAVLFGSVFLLIYWPVMEQEEQHLRKLFPEYADYARRVPMIGVKPTALNGGPGFSAQQYLRNQEYKALSASLIGYALLWWKSVAF